MSRCISSHGEYSAHELVGNRCEWCRVWQCPVCGEDLPYPLDGEDHDCAGDAVTLHTYTDEDLDGIRADAWDEGFNSGHYSSNEQQDCDCKVNPYLAGGTR